MKNSNEWFSVAELLAARTAELPRTDKGISKKADRENWEKRQRSGVKGKTFEYHYTSLPESVQKALGCKKQPVTLMPSSKACSSIKSLDINTLALAIETLEEALLMTERIMEPAKKAELIVAIYELLLEEENNKEPVLRLIKSIA